MKKIVTLIITILCIACIIAVFSNINSPRILVNLGITTEEELNKDGNITAVECFEALGRAMGYSNYNTEKISEWYMDNRLEKLDYIDDSTKLLLLRMHSSSIVSYDEIALLNPYENITEYEALLYIVRMVGDTYGCTDIPIENVDPEKKAIYKTAYEKGLISDKNADSADRLITKNEFYDILHKSLFAEYKRGHSGGVSSYRLIERHDRKYENGEEVKQKKEKVQLSINAVINKDLSVEWTVPEQYNSFTAGRMTELALLGKDGTEKMVSMSSNRTDIRPYELIRYLVSQKEKDRTVLRCNYIDSGSDIEYYFDIDISKIKIVTEGEEINPGKYVLHTDSWCAKEISLADGENFESGCYYILKGYENKYRDPKYNTVAYEVFMAEEAANTFIAPTNRSFGVHNYDEVHIQKLTVSGNAEEGFVLSITPESAKGFTVEEASDSE